MDGETKTLLLVIAAIAGGALLGWCIKQNLRTGRAPAMGARAPAPAADDGSFITVSGTSNPGGDCGCRS
jgi:hypothetical protein